MSPVKNILKNVFFSKIFVGRLCQLRVCNSIIYVNEGGEGILGITVFDQICLGISGKWLKSCGITVFEFHSILGI